MDIGASFKKVLAHLKASVLCAQPKEFIGPWRVPENVGPMPS